MKKWIMGLMLVVLVSACALNVSAERHDKFRGERDKFHDQRDNQERDDAGYILHRSAMLVFDAQKAAEHGHHYKGLAWAIGNQQRARELYLGGQYRDAIFHSLRARDLAIQIIRENRGNLRREFLRDGREDGYAHNAPRGEDLDVKLDMHKIGRDDAIVHLKFELDINQ